MSNSKRSSAKFWLLSAVVVIATAAGLAALWPLTRTEAASESKQLSNQAAKASGGEVQSDYQLAVWLNPANQTARLGLATSQLSANEPEAALGSLRQAGEGTTAIRLSTRALIETGNYSRAAVTAAKLTNAKQAPDSDYILQMLADALSNNLAQVQALTPRLTSPEALQDASRINAGKLPLAEVLYATGLLRSSNAILKSLPDSYQRDLLMGQIYYSLGDPANYGRAINSLSDAARQDPAQIAPRHLLVTIYRDQNQFTLADTQQSLLNKLSAGQP